MDRFNQRHPWSHNDHFHPWVTRHLPGRRRRALDVGCGRGELIEKLAPSFDQVLGIDIDARMRRAARRRVAQHSDVFVTSDHLAELDSSFDLITMIAVLHHMDAESALIEARRLLVPGGRLMVVGIARPEGPVDAAWEAACLLSNPIIGMAKHPAVATPSVEAHEFATVAPEETLRNLRQIFGRNLPGTRLRRQLGFRYTAVWTKSL